MVKHKQTMAVVDLEPGCTRIASGFARQSTKLAVPMCPQIESHDEMQCSTVGFNVTEHKANAKRNVPIQHRSRAFPDSRNSHTTTMTTPTAITAITTTATQPHNHTNHANQNNQNNHNNHNNHINHNNHNSYTTTKTITATQL
ncbi:hypothetical protein FHG87_005063 [Trinorchestia longiramus]|nr:hypothetical protein FHG87_005063 [Trinorchestia longiramus]